MARVALASGLVFAACRSLPTTPDAGAPQVEVRFQSSKAKQLLHVTLEMGILNGSRVDWSDVSYGWKTLTTGDAAWFGLAAPGEHMTHVGVHLRLEGCSESYPRSVFRTGSVPTRVAVLATDCAIDEVRFE